MGSNFGAIMELQMNVVSCRQILQTGFALEVQKKDLIANFF